MSTSKGPAETAIATATTGSGPDSAVVEAQVASVMNTITCPICLGILVEAVESSCGHSFCCSCIVEWREKGSIQCPCCRKPAGLIHPSFTLRDLISALLKLASIQRQEEEGAGAAGTTTRVVSALLSRGVLVAVPEIHSNPAPSDAVLNKAIHAHVRIPLLRNADGVNRFATALPAELEEAGMNAAAFGDAMAELNQLLDRGLPSVRLWLACMCCCCVSCLFCGPCWMMHRYEVVEGRCRDALHRFSTEWTKFSKGPVQGQGISSSAFSDGGVRFSWELHTPPEAQRREIFPSSVDWIEVEILPLDQGTGLGVNAGSGSSSTTTVEDALRSRVRELEALLHEERRDRVAVSGGGGEDLGETLEKRTDRTI